MTGIALRPAVHADRDAVAKVWLDGFRSNGVRVTDEATYAGLRARVDREFAAGWQVTVAEVAGGVVGFAALQPQLAKLDQLFVTPVCQGRGVGRALFAHTRRATPDGFHLWTHGENRRAQRFYESLAPLRWEDGVHPRHGHPIRTYWFAGALSLPVDGS